MEPTSHGADKSPLFTKLPAEIRNTIWSYAVSSEQMFPTRVKPLIVEPPLLNVSKQVRFEARSIFYSDSTFGVVSHGNAGRFLTHLRDDQMKMMRRFKALGNVVCHDWSEGGDRCHTPQDLLRVAFQVGRDLMDRYGGRGLREEAILVPLPVRKCGGREGVEFVPLTKLCRWVGEEERSSSSRNKFYFRPVVGLAGGRRDA